jgi:peptidylprolyl isomerase
VAKLSTIAVTLLFTAAVLMITTVGCGSRGGESIDTPRIAGAGTHVTMQYTMRLEDGTEVASNVGASPLSFTIGQEEVFPALEAALEGLTVGDERSVSLTAEQAYGPRDEDAVREVDLELVPEESRLVGSVLMAEDGVGGQREVTIRELRDKTVVLDLNHPMAGEALSVDIRIVSVRLPQDSE